MTGRQEDQARVPVEAGTVGNSVGSRDATLDTVGLAHCGRLLSRTAREST